MLNNKIDCYGQTLLWYRRISKCLANIDALNPPNDKTVLPHFELSTLSTKPVILEGWPSVNHRLVSYRLLFALATWSAIRTCTTQRSPKEHSHRKNCWSTDLATWSIGASVGILSLFPPWMLPFILHLEETTFLLWHSGCRGDSPKRQCWGASVIHYSFILHMVMNLSLLGNFCNFIYVLHV